MPGPFWKLLLLEIVLGLIAEANGGHWPQNIWQWRRVAKRFGVTLQFVRVEGAFTARLHDDLLQVRWEPRACKSLRWLVHELTEAILTWEGEPEYRYQLAPGETDEGVRHQIARLVENILIASA